MCKSEFFHNVILLEIYFETCIHLYTIVLDLHCALLFALIVAEWLVEEVVGFSKDCELVILAPSVAHVEVKIVHLVVVAVEFAAASVHLVDEARCEVVRQADIDAVLLKIERSVGCVLWRTCHLHVFAILDTEALVVIASGGVGVSVGG